MKITNNFINLTSWDVSNNKEGHKVSIRKDDIIRIWDGNTYRQIFLKSKNMQSQGYITIANSYNDIINML